MKPLTAEWIDQAEGDFAVMERESRVRKHPAFDVVCFTHSSASRSTSRHGYVKLTAKPEGCMTWSLCWTERWHASRFGKRFVPIVRISPTSPWPIATPASHPRERRRWTR
jgi:hypothetical protein